MGVKTEMSEGVQDQNNGAGPRPSEIRLTSVMSMPSGRMSVLDRFCTTTSSSTVLHTMYTMNPLLSKSSARERVTGRFGDPAMTTTSSLAPFLARLALLVLRQRALFRIPRYTTTLVVRTMKPVRILCREIQSCAAS